MQKERFSLAKIHIQNKINSLRLGNYIRMLMFKNNNLIDDKFYFLNDGDFKNIKEEDMNYANMQSSDDKSEFKARLFALKFGFKHHPGENLKPYSVADESRNLKHPNWKNFVVLLIGNKGENYLTRICFTKDIQDNFALILDFNDDCNDRINIINSYRILDNKYFPTVQYKIKTTKKYSDGNDENEKPKIPKQINKKNKQKNLESDLQKGVKGKKIENTKEEKLKKNKKDSKQIDIEDVDLEIDNE